MLTLVLALSLAQYPQHRLFLQPNLPAGQSFAFFEAFPTSGAGTTAACSTTAPTGAKGEALTFTRTGNGTCTKTASGGLATTGIADGDLVVLSGNQPRVEYDSNGTLGLLVESARTNVFLQSGDISNAVNTDVATPTLTGSQTDPFGTSTAVQMDDNNAAAYEGRTQTVTVSAGAAYIMSCFIKGGTSTLARLSLDGTGCNVSGLSTTTWTRATCADASSSGAAIAAQVLVGNATTDTGTIIVGGCQVEAGTYVTSYQPTGAGTATRNAEAAYFTVASTEVQSLAVTAQVPAGIGTNSRFIVATNTSTATLSQYATGPGSTPLHNYQFVNPSTKDYTGAANVVVSSLNRLATWVIPSTTMGAIANGSESTTSSGVLGSVTATRIYVGCYEGGAGFESNSIHTRACADPLYSRCR